VSVGESGGKEKETVPHALPKKPQERPKEVR